MQKQRQKQKLPRKHEITKGKEKGKTKETTPEGMP